MSFFIRFRNFCDFLLPYAFVGLSFTIPINYRWAIYFIALIVLFWLFSIEKKDFLNLFKNNWIAILLSLLWLLEIVSLIYTTDISRGINNISQNISLLLFPLILSTKGKVVLSQFNKILKAFCLGLVVIGLYFIVIALSKSVFFTETGILFQPRPINAPWENNFLYDLFTNPLHPTYVAMYYTFGIAILAYLAYPIKSVKSRLGYYIVGCFYCLIIYLASSKAGLIIGGIVSIMSLLWIVNANNRKFYGIGVGMLMIVFSVLLLKNDRINFFWKQLTSKIETKGLSQEHISAENKLKNDATIRIQIWKGVPKVIGKNWLLGLGIGDTKNELVKYYHENNILYAEQMRLNAHNQYLETLLGTGTLGLIILIGLMVYSIRLSLKKKDMFFFLLAIIIGLNLVFESMLERFPGVVFISFFLMLLSQKINTKECV